MSLYNFNAEVEMSFHKIMNFETKQAIKQALIIRIEKVGFERVTVKKSCFDCKHQKRNFLFTL